MSGVPERAEATLGGDEMSGGSWDYISEKFVEVGDRLVNENDARRVALGHLIRRVALALHAIEWNDSGDGHDGEAELIMACITPAEVTDQAVVRLKSEIARAQRVLADNEGGKR
jgi:hypothetical protein